MPSTFTTNLNLEKQATGENANTWGTKLNADLDQIDSSVGGNLTISVAGNTDVTPTTTQAQNIFHHLTGALTGNINYIVPTAGRLYLIDNQTTGAFTVTVKTSGGTGVVVPQGFRTFIYCDGTNCSYPDTSQQIANQTYAASGGSANAYTLTLSPAPGEYAAGMVCQFKANFANTGAATLNINSLGAKNIYKKTSGGVAALAGGEIQNGDLVTVQYDGTQFQLMNANSLSVVGPNGSVTDGQFALFSGTTGQIIKAQTGALKSKLITATKNLADASTTQAITGVGFKPTALLVLAAVGGAGTVSFGLVDSSKSASNIDQAGSTLWGADGSSAIHLQNSSNQGQNGIINSFDSDGFTIGWTQLGGGTTGTGTVYALCFL